MSGNLFYAFEITHQATQDNLLSVVKDLSEVVPRATWTSLDKMHVTLLFLGNVPEQPAAERLARACLGRGPFTITIKGSDCFYSSSGPRVIYAKIDYGAHNVIELNEALGGNAKYTPHLTLGKLDGRGDFAPEFSEMAEHLKGHAFGKTLVATIKLYRTVGGGEPYEVVADHMLAQ